MTYLKDKYINPFTDYGFKKLFGEEVNKDILMDFLNELLSKEAGRIVNLTYLKTEFVGYTLSDRKSVFDIYCENEKGEKFIVEMQKTKQKFFKDRTLYYATLPIREQAEKNQWDFSLKAVYVIAILDFIFEDDKDNPDKYRYDVKLEDIDTHKVFYDKLTFIYLEMPKFNKSLEQITTRFEKWLYVIKNLANLDKVPNNLREKIFEKLFEAAEIARFTSEQIYNYEESLNVFRDLKNSLDTAREEGEIEGEQKGFMKGIIEGKIEGKIEIVKNALNKGLSVKMIAELTGMSAEEIEEINKKL